MTKRKIALHQLSIAVLMITLAVPCLAEGPVTVDTKALSSPAADPFVSYVSVGPKHEFEPVYRVLEPDACSVLAHRVLILHYANYDNIVIEELGFTGSKCQDIRVRKSLSINGVTLGYALGEGTRFAWDLKFLVWEAWNSFLIRSAKRNFRISISRDGTVSAEPEVSQDAG